MSPPVGRTAANAVNSQSVFITVDDVVDVVLDAALAGTIDGDVRLLDSGEKASLLAIAERQLEDVSQVLHASTKRCAGFVFHRSELDAYNALAGPDPTAQFEAVQYTIDNDAAVVPLVAAVTETEIMATIGGLTSFKNRYYKTPSGVAAATWLKEHWSQLGATRGDVTVELFAHSDWPQPSVIMTIPGRTLPDEIVVLGAHLDSISGWSTGNNTLAPGADDDASGIAARSQLRSAKRTPR